jgi:hypothetical protein
MPHSVVGAVMLTPSFVGTVRKVRLPGSNEVNHGVSWSGPAEKESLPLITACRPKVLGLRGGLDSFGHSRETEGSSEIQDSRQDCGVLRAAGQVTNEGLVDFQNINRVLLEMQKRRIASAEII